MGTPTSEFRYELPEDAIAQTPVEPRDSARLLNTRDLSDHVFSELPDLLESGDLVVVNRSRVRAARMTGTKPSGGRIEALLLRPLAGGRWQAAVRPARRLQRGAELDFGRIKAVVESTPREGLVELSLTADGDLKATIAEVGSVPLPPYIYQQLHDPERYQTIFAQELGSAAAPTAGLHFTESLVSRLRDRSIDIAEIELQIGLDTFRPISTDSIESHRIHSEAFQVPSETARAVAACQRRGGRVIAVGTTVVRALESRANASGDVEPGAGSTSLYITPGFRFAVVDILLTNFHLPATSLIVLVAAFMGEDWRKAYATALQRGYRFLSFGDAMLTRRREPRS
ncbi:MAG: tRNA preQ1(34) S-adenosylmethionine ribosyltransferase-isomerase QueA [Acidimicrobiia bacterium]